MIQAVLFDMDGLMFDTERLCHRIFLQIGVEQNIPNMAAASEAMRGRNYAGCAKVCQQVISPTFDYEPLWRECTRRMQQEFDQKGIPLKPGLVPLLQELRRRGIPAVLATSTKRATAKGYLEKAGLSEYFCGLVCGDEVSHSKPDPEIFIKAAKLAGAPPAACLVLEDSPNGIRAAAAAGCIGVMVPDMDEPTDELRGLARCVLNSLDDVKNALDRF